MARVILLQFGGLIYFLIFIQGAICGRNRKTFQYEECKVGDSLINNSSVVVLSGIHSFYRQYQFTRLNDSTGTWIASAIKDPSVFAVKDPVPFLTVDLGDVHIVTKVHTQGRKGRNQYVTDFTIEYSMDNITWEEYTNERGLIEVFKGNIDSDNVKENTLMYPVITQYVRFRPFRWNKHISMSVDVIGCLYVSEVIQTSDGGYIVYDAAGNQSTQTEEDLIMLRFRTIQENGILLYAGGNYGDFLLIELRRGQLHLKLDLGSTRTVTGVTPVAGRRVLADGKWHDVIFQRNKTVAKLIVDRRETEFKTNGFFFRFNLHGQIYLGGLDYFNKNGVSNLYNFNGCIDFVRFNGINMIKGVNDRLPRYQLVGPVAFTCSLETTQMSLCFLTRTAHRIFGSGEAGSVVNATFQFRTFDKDAVLLRFTMNGPFEVQVGFDWKGFVYYKITEDNNVVIQDSVENTDIEGNVREFTDGLWHTFDMFLSSTMINVTVDTNSRVTNKELRINPPNAFTFGGDGLRAGFRGCLRNMEIMSTPVDLESLKVYPVDTANFGPCNIKDRCFPNPCEHSGKCSQDWDTFYCDCGSTGYKGAVCHISAHPLSCTVNSMHKKQYMKTTDKKLTIDPDGSGPIDPFAVTCKEDGAPERPFTCSDPYSYNGPAERGICEAKGMEAFFRYEVETLIAHDSMRLTTVDGYQAPDYFVHKVEYDGDLTGLTEVIERSDSCEQEILWKCNNSRLMAMPSEDSSSSKTYGYWVGRTYQNMYHWGGSAPGIYKCACGVSDKGCILNGTTCNCDSGGQAEDWGLLRSKEFLPVLELYFGDTGTISDDKVGQFQLGELKCSGENMLDNVITFRKADAYLEFPTFRGGSAIDIWFQIKTTALEGVIIHGTGDTEDHFIKISLKGGYIQLSFNVGNGIRTYDYSITVNNDKWHSVHVERNLKQSWVTVDNLSGQIFYYSSSEFTRLLELTRPLAVGAVVNHTDGFVGCIRSLRVNGVLIDLKGAVRNGKTIYGVHEGCVGKCVSSPCVNQGRCVEGYSHYTCDCTFTPFEGRICSREIGVNIRPNNLIMIRHDSSAYAIFEYGFKIIRISFMTKKKQGILLQVRSEYRLVYISIEMNNNDKCYMVNTVLTRVMQSRWIMPVSEGGVKVFLDFFYERWELNTDVNNIDLTDGQTHELVIRREQRGRMIFMQVDRYTATRAMLGEKLFESLEENLSDIDEIYIGNNDTENTNHGFEGCIYRVQIDSHYPLKTAFQDPTVKKDRPIDVPIPKNVTFSPNGTIHKGTCEFEEVTHAPDPAEERVYSPGCGMPVPAPVKDRGGKHLTDGDLFFSFSLQNITFEKNVTDTKGPLTMTCRVTSANISVVYYILIQQETSPGSGEFECVAMIESGGMQTPTLYDHLVTVKDYIINGTLDRAKATYPYLSLGIDAQNLTRRDAKDYVCEVAYKNSSSEMFEKVSTVSTIMTDDFCVIQKKPKTEKLTEEQGLKTNAKIGIAVGVVGGVLIIIAIIAAVCVSNRRKKGSQGIHTPTTLRHKYDTVALKLNTEDYYLIL